MKSVRNPSAAAATAALALAFAVGLVAGPRVAAGDPQVGAQHQTFVQSDMQVLQNKVGDLEKKLGTLQQQLAALQQQHATHTHNYVPPRCNQFLNLATFKNVLNNPGSDAGMGVCLVAPGGSSGVATTAPNH